MSINCSMPRAAVRHLNPNLGATEAKAKAPQCLNTTNYSRWPQSKVQRTPSAQAVRRSRELSTMLYEHH